MGLSALAEPFAGPAADPSHRARLEAFARNPVLLVELSSRCNFRCAYCRSASSTRQKSFMSREVFERVLSQAADLTDRPLRFHIDGEPTLHPHFHEFGRLANGAGLRVALATNGSTLSPRYLDLALDLRINLSSSAQELARRSSLFFGPYLQRLMAYVVAWDAENSAQNIIYQVFSSAAERRTPGAIEGKVAFARGFVARLGLSDRGTWSGEGATTRFRYANRGGGGFELALTAVTEGGLYPSPDAVPACDGLPKDFGFCDAPWKTFAVLSDGAPAYCCVDVTGATAFGPPGDVLRRSLREIWFDDPVLNGRRAAFLEGRVGLAECRQCLDLAPHREHYLFTETFEKTPPPAIHVPRRARNVVVLANCVGGALADMLARHPACGPSARIKAYENFTRPSIEQAEWDACDLFIYQPLDEAWGWGDLASDRILSRLPPTCRTISLPALQFVALWPFYAADRRNRKTPEHPHGKYFYGDSFVLERLQQGLSREQIVREYLDADVARLARLDDLLAAEFRKIREAERSTDVKVAEFIEQRFRTVSLFGTVNHPRRLLLVFMFLQIAARLGLPRPDAAWYASLPDYFGEVESPIHPAIARHFGLTYAGPSTRYRHWDKSLTFEEYLADYIEFR